MAIAWDATLPAYFVPDGFQIEPPDNTVWNETLSGRFTSELVSNHNSEPMQVPMVMNLAQFATFRAWYADPTKCNRGNAPFQNLNDPFTGSNAVWRFVGKWTATPHQGGGHMLVRMPLLKLPDAPV